MYIQDIVKVISLLQINDFSCFSTNDFQSFRENSSLKLYNRFSSLNIFYSAESCVLLRSGELFLVHHISIQRGIFSFSMMYLTAWILLSLRLHWLFQNKWISFGLRKHQNLYFISYLTFSNWLENISTHSCYIYIYIVYYYRRFIVKYTKLCVSNMSVVID